MLNERRERLGDVSLLMIYPSLGAHAWSATPEIVVHSLRIECNLLGDVTDRRAVGIPNTRVGCDGKALSPGSSRRRTLIHGESN